MLFFLVAHDLFRKPLHTFRDHALAYATSPTAEATRSERVESEFESRVAYQDIYSMKKLGRGRRRDRWPSPFEARFARTSG